MHSTHLSRRPGHPPSGARITVQPPVPTVPALPYAKWPKWIQLLSWYAHQPKDIGFGDTVVHIIGDTRSAAFKKWFAEKFGKSCGCSERQSWLNHRYPYTQTLGDPSAAVARYFRDLIALRSPRPIFAAAVTHSSH